MSDFPFKPSEFFDATDIANAGQPIPPDKFDELMNEMADYINNKLARQITEDGDTKVEADEFVVVKDLIGQDSDENDKWRINYVSNFTGLGASGVEAWVIDEWSGDVWENRMALELSTTPTIYAGENTPGLVFPDGSRIDSNHFNSDGQVNNYKGNDIDSDGDGKVDDSDQYDSTAPSDGTTDQVLATDGSSTSWSDVRALSTAGGKEVFTSDTTWTVPTGVDTLLVTIQGAGAGGGGGGDCGNDPHSGQNGSDGGNSSFGGITASGGNGGETSNCSAGSGGWIGGQDGSSSSGGNGGDSLYGNGGGGGACCSNNNCADPGGDGGIGAGGGGGGGEGDDSVGAGGGGAGEKIERVVSTSGGQSFSVGVGSGGSGGDPWAYDAYGGDGGDGIVIVQW